MLHQVESVPSERTDGRGSRTVACIEIRVAGAGAEAPGRDGVASPTPAVLEFALGQVQRAVRTDDRICPIGTSRLAVEFGPVASGVLPQVLGDRLARAIGQTMPFDSSVAGLAVSVGMAAPERTLGSPELTRRAMAAAAAGRSQLGRGSRAGTVAPDTVVTVDRLVSSRAPASDSGRSFQPIRRRSTYRYEAGRVRGIPTLRPTRWSPNGHPVLGHQDIGANLTVLVVDPLAPKTGDPGLAATTAASVAERMGCRTAAVAVSIDDQLALSVEGVPLDLVVLVLDGGWVGRSPTWSSGAWGVPARLTASYQSLDVPVLAVSAGAGAGAIASCVAQGALALFNLERLPDALRSLHRDPGEDLLHVTGVGLSPRFRALVGLTASERRVLFYLTEGWAAQEIADELVVSLTTVRSHIRSVLRKLGVRSQLAAVAVANSRDLQHDVSGEAS